MENPFLGTNTALDFLYYFFLALLGAVAFIAMEARGRNKHSDRTPKEWSIMFFIEDNVYRFLLTIISVYLIARYNMGDWTWEQIGIKPFSNSANDMIYVILGFTNDLISMAVKKGYIWIQKKIKA